jgi:5,10-methylenetetrahydromethanopterin reductase
MELGCAFAPGLATPDHIAVAERLGYRMAWVYDSPALYHDVWVTLARAAERTSAIGLGPGVLVPHLRHVMVNAAGIATLADLAPGRIHVAVGSGFTGSRTLGLKPNRWSDVGAYVDALRALLAGETITWDGQAIRMMHPDGFGPARPIEVPVLVGANGPKGLAVARRCADGVFLAGDPGPAAGFARAAMLLTGTVLDAGEDPTSARVLDAAGHAAAVALHAGYEWGFLDALPGGGAYRGVIDAIPVEERHLALHDRHLVSVTERDEPFVRPMLPSVAWTAESLPGRLAAFAAAGVTEIAYQPAGPDIPRELAAFAAAARETGAT